MQSILVFEFHTDLIARAAFQPARNHQSIIFAINQLEALAEKGNQGLAWSEEEDELLAQRFSEGFKITQLAKLHSRTYGAIKARLIKLELLQK